MRRLSLIMLVLVTLPLAGCADAARLVGVTSCDDLLSTDLRALLSRPVGGASRLAEEVALLTGKKAVDVRPASWNQPSDSEAEYEDDYWVSWDTRRASYSIVVRDGVAHELHVSMRWGRPTIRRWVACAGQPSDYAARVEPRFQSGVGFGPMQTLAIALYNPEQGMVALHQAGTYLEPQVGQQHHLLSDNVLNYPITGFVFAKPGSIEALIRAHEAPPWFGSSDWLDETVALQIAEIHPWPVEDAGFTFYTNAEWSGAQPD